ncbi:membrane-associated phospholipid phosphatase [Catenibacillus scindens]|uniref:Membrane-associated phospholipid phosphatase n=1 Tax=Catenibacillus scindens TaxID=673271 RepID=A0A7W8M4Y8_9FIRM|nr:phosphatase PAP2 family protein [Catenibacillus scindens]MBB5263786.1 membrane-associated phospholipid phosphatase [Catenibacillus scindens]
MSEKFYKNTTDFIREKPRRMSLIYMIARVFPIAIGAIYLFLCVITGLIMPLALFRFIGVPLAAFVLVTVGRVLFHRKRPYEVYRFTPITFNKKRLKKGKSFPSRHTASAAVIAMACMSLVPSLGAAMLVMAALVGISRVLCGLHFLSDVAVGFVFGIIVGIIGFCPIIF